MWTQLKHLVLGPPLPPEQSEHKRLNKVRALAAFSPDAISSIGYANQEIYLGLVVAGAVGLSFAFPIALAITALLTILGLSYYQIIQAFPNGGGSYTVSRATLGTLPGLIAAASLMVDYLLCVAVSLTTGVDAIASAFNELWPYRVYLSLLLLVALTVLNLRGLRETGTVMSIPVYLFLFSYLGMLAYGMFRLSIDGPASPTVVTSGAVESVTLFILLRTFSTGCTAMTGIEVISNGVPSFKPPETKNAGRTLILMAVLMGLLFLGSNALTQVLGIVAGPEETILSALARHLLGIGPAYLLIQVSTLVILALGANSSFAGLPRLMSVMAGDGFLPKQLTKVSSRLVFANGILLLALAAGVLIIVFSGSSHALIPLFAVGVFLAYTLSQTGMVVFWRRKRGKGWRMKAAMNGIGAVATGITFVIVGANKFIDGAWIAILLIPILVVTFLRVYGQHKQVDRGSSLPDVMLPKLKPSSSPRASVHWADLELNHKPLGQMHTAYVLHYSRLDT
jgi:amino acid transporter